MEKVEEAKAVQKDNRFLGTEKIGKLLRMFAIPCVLSLVVQALYNIVDQLFIGNASYLGDAGNTATGIVFPLTIIALAVGLMFGDGAAARVSIDQGKNETKNTHKTIGTSLFAGLAVSLILVLVAFLIRNPFFGAFSTSEQVFDFSFEYSTWIIIGFPFFVLGTIMNSVIRADGSPKFAMFAMIIGAVINIILDPIFIFVAKMGMTGAALATAIAQIITFLLSVGYFFKSKSFRLSWKSFIPNFKLLWESTKLGISSFLTQIAIAVVTIVNNAILTKYLPTDESAIGLLTVAFKVFGIVLNIIIGIAVGGQPIVGYNYGAKKYDRVKQTFKIIMITTIVVGLIATILFEACPQIFIKMFGFAVSDFGLKCFRIYLGFILLTCFTKASSIFFQSVGMPLKATLVAMCRDLIFLVPLAIVLPIFGGIDLFMWSAPISDILTTIMSICFIARIYKTVFAAKSTEESAENKVMEIAPSKKGFIVTISREHGAGGREIGKKLAEKLGVPYYDKEIASLVAKESGLAAEYVEDMQTANPIFYSTYLSTEVNQTAIVAQARVLEKIAQNGACVIVGRAADYVLKDYNPFKVFVYAPIEFKVARIMKNYGDSEKEAKENAEKSDKRRAKFYKNVTGQTFADKSNYDLCVDSSIGVAAVVEMLYNLIKEKESERAVQEKPVEVKA